jgi:hypothetical protein
MRTLRSDGSDAEYSPVTSFIVPTVLDWDWREGNAKSVFAVGRRPHA